MSFMLPQKHMLKCRPVLFVDSILTLDAMQNLCKANNLNINADFKDHDGGSQGKGPCTEGKIKI